MFDALFDANGKKVKYMGMVDIQNHFKSCLRGSYKPKTEYIVLWYGPIRYRNRRRVIQVYFLDADTKYQVVVEISPKSILRLPIGSIWVNGKCEEKYEFETLYTTLDAHDDKKDERPNLAYTSHYSISESKGEYILKPDSYPVNKIKTDSNSNLVVQTDTTKIIIPAVLFFVAHYGVSKEINTTLISWHKQEVEKRLNLNDGCGGLITIPDRCVIADAVFLYHLKTDSHTKKVVWELNRKMLRNNLDHLPLRAEPYHKQEIHLKIAGFRIDDQTMLCTEILGISMPQGKPIEYRIDKPNSATYGDGTTPHTSRIKPFYNTVESDEILLEAERDANNIITAVIRHRVEQIGTIRALIKGENLTLDEVVERCNTVIPIPQKKPDAFADGEGSNSNGDIGRIHAHLDSDASTSLQNNFQRLLRYAQELKVTLGYAPVIIDCVNLADENIFIGETVRGMRSAQHGSQVRTVFVMRLITKLGLFYLFDCDKEGAQTSGVVIKIIDQDGFTEGVIRQVLGQLFRGNGRLSDESAISKYGIVQDFRHTNGEGVNWVRTAIDNLEKGVLNKNKDKKDE